MALLCLFLMERRKWRCKSRSHPPLLRSCAGKLHLQQNNLSTHCSCSLYHRLTRLKDLQLPVQSRFSLSLIFDKLTPAILMNITRIAGYGDDTQNHFSTIMDQIHSKMHFTPTTPHHSLPYQQLCESHIQVAAAKSLQGILFNESMIKLLGYHPPPKDAAKPSGGAGDKSSLAVSVREVLRCLITRAIKPSPLKIALRPMEMERVYSIVSYECLGAVSECKNWGLHTCAVIGLEVFFICTDFKHFTFIGYNCRCLKAKF